MKPFTVHTGVAAALLRPNIDTDAIIPSREMKRVSKRGLGEGLFAGWRYLYEGIQRQGLNPEFILNQPDYANASILLGGANFGCGSSREHAVWALDDYGIRVIIAPSFGAIFYNNCVRNGLLPVRADEAIIAALAQRVEESPRSNRLTVDLAQCRFGLENDPAHAFEIDTGHRETLLGGLDPIAMTLQHEGEIQAAKERLYALLPWTSL